MKGYAKRWTSTKNMQTHFSRAILTTDKILNQISGTGMWKQRVLEGHGKGRVFRSLALYGAKIQNIPILTKKKKDTSQIG